jgi:hypothetical protein
MGELTKHAPHNDKDAHWYLIEGTAGISARNQENGGRDGGLTISKVTIQMGCAGEFCGAEWAKLSLGELWDVSPVRAHARDSAVLLVLYSCRLGRR